MLKNKKGFTLIELTVVMAVLIVLAAALIPKATGAQTQAKIFTDKASIMAINEAIALHCAANNFSDLTGQTSISVVQPIKSGDSVTVIVQYLKDKGLLADTAQIFLPQGHNYAAVDNKVN